MIQHVVMLRFKPGTDARQIAELEDGLRALPDVIDEIRQYDFGQDVVASQRSWDFALVSSFTDLASLQRYQRHPDHQKVLAIIQHICDHVQVVDFKI